MVKRCLESAAHLVFVAPFLVFSLTAACTDGGPLDSDALDAADVPPDVPLDGPLDGPEAPEETDHPLDGLEIDDAGDGSRDPLICDAVYLPFVVFTFMDASTGKAYCGPAAVTYEVVGGGETGTAFCDCVEGAMASLTYGSMPCHINPPEGETSLLTVSVEGYEDFSTEVTLPYECHPEKEVDVLLQPAAEGCPPSRDVSVSVFGPRPYPQSSLTIASDARIVSLRRDVYGALLIDVDFSEFDPELAEETFGVGVFLEDILDMAVGDVVHVDYAYERSLPRDDTRLAISRDMETLVLGYDLGHSGEDRIVCGPMTLDIIQGRCLQLPDYAGCAIFERIGYTITCDSTADFVEVYDSSRTTAACGAGSGYEVLVGDFYRLVEDLDRCTDIPGRVTQLVIIKRP